MKVASDMLPTGTRSRLATIKLFACCMLVGLCVALVYHATLKMLGFTWPWTSFLFQEADQYNDWHNSVAQAASGDPYFFHGTPALAAYFPGAYLIFDLARGLSWQARTFVYLGISLTLLATATFMSAAYSRELAIPESVSGTNRQVGFLLFFSALCAYPVWFAVDRGNIDLWVACGCIVFVATLGKRMQPLGVVALAIAIAAKGYPAAFLILLIVRRSYWAVVFCLATVAVISLAALLSFNGSISHSVSGLQDNLHLFYERYVLDSGSMFGSSDPYNAIRSASYYIDSKVFSAASVDPHALLVSVSAKILRVYSVLSFTFALVATGFALAIPARPWRRVTAICLLAILFPNVANDYKLCCLLPGLLTLLVTNQQSRRESICLILFFFLMIPKSYIFIKGYPISLFINPMLLTALAWEVMADRRAWRRGWQLSKFRLIWYLAELPGGSTLARWANRGKRVAFLDRKHASLELFGASSR